MLIYLGMYLLSIIAFTASEFMSKKSKFIFTLTGLMLPCLMAGMRADTVGTDVKAYLIPMFNNATISSNIIEFFNSSWLQHYTIRYVSSIEIGFSLFVYFTSKVFHNLYILQFIIQFLIIFPIYCALSKISNFLNKKIITLGILTYYLMFYNYSLNLMRQFIAIGFLLYGFSCLIFDNSKMKYFVFQILSFLFHTSSILGLIIFIFYKFITSDSFTLSSKIVKYDRYKIRSIILICVLVIIIFLLPIIVNIVRNRFGDVKYIGYIDGVGAFSINQLIIYIPFLFILLMNFQFFKKKYHEKYWLIFTMLMMILLLSQLVDADGSASSKGAYRIVLYFSSFLIFIIPIMCIMLYNKNTFVYRILLIGYLFCWWFYYYGFSSDNSMIYNTFWR